jgi:hypothetical protein
MKLYLLAFLFLLTNVPVKQKEAYQKAAEKYNQLQNFYQEYQNELEEIYIEKPDTLEKVLKMMAQAKKKFESLGVEVSEPVLEENTQEASYFENGIENPNDNPGSMTASAEGGFMTREMLDEGEDGIPKKPFKQAIADACKGLANTVKDFATGLKDDATTINKENLKTALSNGFTGSIPAMAKIRDELTGIIDNHKDGTPVKELCKKLENHLRKYQNNDDNIKIPVKNRVKPENVPSKLILPEDLLKALDQAVPKDDFLTEEEKEKKKAEEEARKAKEEARKAKLEEEREELLDELEEFNTAYATWLKEQNDICAKIISADQKTDSTYLMPKLKFVTKLLKVSEDWYAAQPELTEQLRTTIIKNLKQDSLEVGEVVTAMSNALIGLKIDIFAAFVNWKTNKRLPDYNSLRTTIITSNKQTNTDACFISYMNWMKKVGGVVDSLSPSVSQFNTKALLKALKNKFDQVPNNHLSVIYPLLESEFSKLRPVAKLEDVSKAWQDGLLSFIQDDKNIYSQHIAKMIREDAQLDLELRFQKIEGLLFTTASVDSLKAIFFDHRYIPPTLSAVGVGDSLVADLIFNDSTILNLTLFTEIQKAKGKALVIPKNISSTTVSGEEKYSFEIKDFHALSPDVNSGLTEFTFKILYSKNLGSTVTGTDVTVEGHADFGFERAETKIRNWEYSTDLTVGVGAELIAQINADRSYGLAHQRGKETTSGRSFIFGGSSGTTTIDNTTEELGDESSYYLYKGYIQSDLGTNKVEEIQVLWPILPNDFSTPDS